MPRNWGKTGANHNGSGATFRVECDSRSWSHDWPDLHWSKEGSYNRRSRQRVSVAAVRRPFNFNLDLARGRPEWSRWKSVFRVDGQPERPFERQRRHGRHQCLWMSHHLMQRTHDCCSVFRTILFSRQKWINAKKVNHSVLFLLYFITFIELTKIFKENTLAMYVDVWVLSFLSFVKVAYLIINSRHVFRINGNKSMLFFNQSFSS